jgi:glycosyltransferase involved in cell wall biosynthesis
LGVARSVRFTGALPHDRLVRFFDDADCLLHSSRYEAQAVVIAEALCAGLPVVSTHVGLAADLAGGAVVTVPVGDARALAENALALLASPSSLEAMAFAARDWTARHDVASSTRAFSQLYARLLRRSP